MRRKSFSMVATLIDTRLLEMRYTYAAAPRRERYARQANLAKDGLQNQSRQQRKALVQYRYAIEERQPTAINAPIVLSHGSKSFVDRPTAERSRGQSRIRRQLAARGESPGVAPRPARRPDGKARRPRISGNT